MKDYTLTLTQNVRVAQDIHRLTFAGLDEAFYDEFVPGQFAHIAVPGAPQHILRRPVSIASVNRVTGEMTLFCMIVGEGTRLLCAAKEGVQLPVLAPLGKGYPAQSGVQNAFLLGGGMGVAPMLAAAQTLIGKKTAFLGWRDAEHVYGKKELEGADCAVEAFTDNGSAFAKGFAIEGLLARIDAGETPDLVLACGPKRMLQALQNKLPKGIPCFVSLEERMGCGVGACLTCTCKIDKTDHYENQRVCVDGPVFPLSEVRFED